MRENAGTGRDGTVASGEVDALVDEGVAEDGLTGVKGRAVKSATRTRNAETGVSGYRGREVW